LKHTNMEDKHWIFRRVKKGCRGSIHTNLDVDAVLDCNPRWAAEEMKTVPQIYHEEASSASADLETVGEFPTYKSVKTAMYRKRAQKFPRPANSPVPGDSTPLANVDSYFMAANLHLVLNERGNYNLVHEGRIYNLKRTNMEDKQWVCRRVKKECRGSIHTNLDVDAILDCNPHAGDCIPDNDIFYKMEKRTVLKRRAAEEMKTVPQIYHEEASSASADMETAGNLRRNFRDFRQQLEIPPRWRMTKFDRRFLLYNNVYNSILIFWIEENLSILSEYTVWSMDGTFKIVPEWYQQMFTIHVFIAGKLVPLVYCLIVHKDLSTYREIFDNLILKAAALGVVLQPQTVICDFETALIPALQGTFPGVNIQGCYFHFCQAVLRKVTDLGMRTSYIHERIQVKSQNVAGNGFFAASSYTCCRGTAWQRCYGLLIDEQGSTETLIQQVTSGRVTARDLQIKNKKYELQQRITALTAEYNGGMRTLEQFLRAVAYLVPEGENY
ncbi:hypothetical protein T06_863, partial [Trichinella sp. T6]